jgi:hypothetical protein
MCRRKGVTRSLDSKGFDALALIVSPLVQSGKIHFTQSWFFLSYGKKGTPKCSRYGNLDFRPEVGAILIEFASLWRGRVRSRRGGIAKGFPLLKLKYEIKLGAAVPGAATHRPSLECLTTLPSGVQ